jgi:hypothetical protein
MRVLDLSLQVFGVRGKAAPLGLDHREHWQGLTVAGKAGPPVR